MEEPDLPLKLDKKAGAAPAYRQIIDQLGALVRSRTLKPGQKLPPERDLALRLKTARGTVKKAYEELVRQGLVTAFRGRGSFVAGGAPPAPPERPAEGSRKDRAMGLIDQFLDRLHQLKFSWREIKALLDLRILEREQALEDLALAAVDCNPEALAIYEKQLFFLPGVRITRYLMDDLPPGAEGERTLAPFDLIITTTTHYPDLLARVGGLQDKILQVAVSPTPETSVRLARLAALPRLGVICESPRFLEIIRNHLRTLDIPDDRISPLPLSEIARLPEFLRDLDAVIVPPGTSLQRRREHLPAVQAFAERGGRLVPFDYQIDRGSLLHLEERLRSLLERR
jgi:DNA-binding transcriptional regulator YhcF (GntR family)